MGFDIFSKWAWKVPLKDTTGITVNNAFEILDKPCTISLCNRSRFVIPSQFLSHRNFYRSHRIV